MRKKYFLGGLVNVVAGTVVPGLISEIIGGGKKGAAASGGGSGGGVDPFVQLYSELEEQAQQRDLEFQQIRERSQDNSMGELANQILGSYLQDIPAKDREAAQKELTKFFIS